MKSLHVLSTLAMADMLARQSITSTMNDVQLKHVPLTNPEIPMMDVYPTGKPICSKYVHAKTLPKNQWDRKKACRRLTKKSRRANRR